MQVKITDYIKSQKKVAGLASAQKFIESVEAVLPQSDDVTFSMSITGGEIHSGESTVNRLNPGETLQQKIARFDRLRQTVAAQRSAFAFMGQLQEEGEAEDDFSFEEGDDVDPFGDPIVKTPVMPSESTKDVESSVGKASAPQNAGEPEKRVDEASESTTENTPDE